MQKISDVADQLARQYYPFRVISSSFSTYDDTMTSLALSSVTNPDSGTTVTEIAKGIFRVSTPMPQIPGGFSFNQFLIVDEKPLLWHCGPLKLYPLVKQAVESILGSVSKLRYVAFSHFESDECGALNEWLRDAPDATCVNSMTASMVDTTDFAIRTPKGMTDGEELELGPNHTVVWMDTPHLPHNWECGYIYEKKTKTLFCGDIMTQTGATNPALTDDGEGILGRLYPLDFQFSFGRDWISDLFVDNQKHLRRMIDLSPVVLAMMHGSSYRGECAGLLTKFAAIVAQAASVEAVPA